LDVKEEEEVHDVYMQSNKDKYGYYYPIDAYQKATEIINKFKKGIFNTEDSDNSHSNLSRDLVEALDTIGNNNIKGIYVGCKEFGSSDRKDKSTQTTSSIPPRLVGRLATTIVMEDGLYIG